VVAGAGAASEINRHTWHMPSRGPYYVIETSYGKFRMKLSYIYDITRTNKTHYILTINGREKDGKRVQCISVTVPSDVSVVYATLNWLESNQACYIVSYEGNKSLSQHLVHLACTIIKKASPHIKYIRLDDMSKLECTVPPPQNKVIVPLSHFYIAFHGATWYESKFGAVIEKESLRQIYYDLLRNFDDPGHKPAWFNFGNEELSDILMPLFTKCHTWREFFSAIAATYADNKCAMVYPWLLSAILHIMDNSREYEGKGWIFDINGPLIKTVKYVSYADGRGGTGGGGTRRRARDVEIGKPIINEALEYASWLPRARAK
jgi:hypothetical protein